jgi:hypothetical protein
VVLSACYSQTQAEAIAQHIECVIGMSKVIGDVSATSFAAAFYQALGYGRDVQAAFKLGCAQIDLENLGDQDIPRLLSMSTDPAKIVFASGPPPPDDAEDEITDAIKRLTSKVDTLHDVQDCRFCLVGAVYLDITLYPITTTELREAEWSNVDPLEYDVGGSALWAGRFLWEKGQKSYLFSALGGDNDPHTVHFNNLFKNECWLLNSLPMGKPGDRTAVTVHLNQSHGRFGTMFTHRGVLRGFGWDGIISQLQEMLTDGGVLYISGYLKTKLDVGLIRNLAKLARNTLVCIDHGRLVRRQAHSDAVQALHIAFDRGLVDLYFCTYNEIFDLFDVNRRQDFPSDWGQVEQLLQKVVKEKRLPLITMVRGGSIQRKTRAFAIVGKSICPLKGSLGPTFIRKTVGPTNAFNASMMYHLVHGRKLPELKDRVIYAGNRAFKEWKKWTKRPK